MPDQRQKAKTHENAHKRPKSKFRCARCGHVSKNPGSCCGQQMTAVER